MIPINGLKGTQISVLAQGIISHYISLILQYWRHEFSHSCAERRHKCYASGWLEVQMQHLIPHIFSRMVIFRSSCSSLCK